MVIDCSAERPFDRQHWLSAREAHELVCARNGVALAASSIASRAHAGLLSTWALLFTFEKATPEGSKAEHSFSNTVLPRAFWWAEGGENLHQNWQSGDFSTRVDSDFEWKAFGVHFDLNGINAMLAPESVPAALPVEKAVLQASTPLQATDEEILQRMREMRNRGMRRAAICRDIRKEPEPGFANITNIRARELYPMLDIRPGRPSKQ